MAHPPLRPMGRNIAPRTAPPTDFIPLYQTGGIGDLIVHLSWLETFKHSPTPVRVYTSYPDIARVMLAGMDVHANTNIASHYKLVSSDVLNFQFTHPYGPEVLPPFLRPIYERWLALKPHWGSYIEKHPHAGNEMAKFAVAQGLRRWTVPFHFLGKPYTKFHYGQHLPPITTPQRFITVHDGVDGNHQFSTRSMKSWDPIYWAMFVAEFKRRHPDVRVVQLGTAKDPPIAGMDIDLRGRTSWEESMRYLKSSLVHVDTDSGLVHARRLFARPSVVIFGPTNVEYFGYPENVNLAPRVCGNCWWKKPAWMRDCVEGHAEALCMLSTKPETVLGEVSKLVLSAGR